MIKLNYTNKWIHVGHPCILGCSHLAVDLIRIVAWEQKEAKHDGQKPVAKGPKQITGAKVTSAWISWIACPRKSRLWPLRVCFPKQGTLISTIISRISCASSSTIYACRTATRLLHYSNRLRPLPNGYGKPTVA